MTTAELLHELPKAVVSGPAGGEVRAVTGDSREAGEGVVFVAVRGTAADGHRYIGDALARGAAAVVAETAPPTDRPETVPWAHVPDSRLALALLGAALAGHPSRRLKLVGVTGTNGKTTTVFLVHHLMKRSWHRAGMLGTVAVDDGETSEAAAHTTPGPVEVQELLGRMADHGCRGAAMEVSSHGIDQKRVAAVAFDAAVFTNLTQDHLDYHRTMERYFAAKRSWFEDLAAAPRGKAPVAVVNLDDPRGRELRDRLTGRMEVTGYGFGVGAEFRAGRFSQGPRGSEFELTARGKSWLVRTPLIGRFNVFNTLAALAAASAVGLRLREIIPLLAEAPQVPGRMENAGHLDGVSVFVDYAHTPDALENACRTLRELQPRKLITVFGCGGDRDRGKRPLMAAAAARHSDAVVVTSDNPRGEDPEAIIDEILAGIGGVPHTRISDRSEAIRRAIFAAEAGDIVLLAGKGHEPYQQFADRTIDFDDRREARRSLHERHEAGPQP
jgi:UDP-N-acetylmuramoyl-L-alanyl-D-glutamate--2,6-diaminopimelate ligase